MIPLDTQSKSDTIPTMAAPWHVTAPTILAIFDVHQRLDWFNAVLEHERGNYDHMVFGGDAMDSFDSPPIVAGARETAKWYAQLLQTPNVTVCLGNHDLPQREVHGYAKQHRRKPHLLNACSGFTQSKAIEFAKEMTHELWSKVRLFVVANGWLLSHAGIREDNWHSHLTDEENLGHLWREAEKAVEMAPHHPHPLFQCGYSRCGTAPYGGPLWLDWDTEFEDNLVYPQLVGHSHLANVHRSIGRSWCIDSGIGYVLIAADGTLTHKTLSRVRDWSKDDGYVWLAGTPKLRDDTAHALARQQSVNGPMASHSVGSTVDPIGDLQRLFESVTKENPS